MMLYHTIKYNFIFELFNTIFYFTYITAISLAADKGDTKILQLLLSHPNAFDFSNI